MGTMYNEHINNFRLTRNYRKIVTSIDYLIRDRLEVFRDEEGTTYM